MSSALPNPDFWHGKRIFLTGHTGFKGSWLAIWLRRMGAQVSGFALPPDATSLAHATKLDHRIHSVTGDIRNAEAVGEAMRAADPEIVLHLAAQALVRHSYREPIETFSTNVMGTAHVLEAVRRLPGVRAVVSVTTDKCYENREWVWAYRETDALGGHDPYSASKAAAELVTASWRRSFLSGGATAIATARAGNVIGGGDWSQDRLVPDCIRAFAAGETVQIRSPYATRPWQHVLEPLCGYLLLAERLYSEGQAFAEAWNFGPSMDDVQPVSQIVKRLAAAWGEGATWHVTDGPHPHEASFLAVDPTLAGTRLDWRPRFRLGTALDRTAHWYRSYLAGTDAASLVEADIAHFESIEPEA